MPLVCVIDADSIIEPDGLLRSTEPFMADDGSLMAVGGAIRVVNGSSIDAGHIAQIGLSNKWLPRFQIVEYLRAFLTARVANAELSMLTLISGAFGIFKRSILIEVGGYRHDTVGEDLELVIRMHRHLRERHSHLRPVFRKHCAVDKHHVRHMHRRQFAGLEMEPVTVLAIERLAVGVDPRIRVGGIRR